MWIKICGITTLADATFLASTDADACGLNFYSKSKRFVSTESAVQLRKCLGPNIEAVGVFVNSPPQEVADIAAAVSLDAVQFHGDETAADIAEFASLAPDVRIIRAFRIGDEGFAAVDASTHKLLDLKVPLHAVLVDAFHPDEYGGTGHRINPQAARNWIANWNGPNVILAGGLKPDNVVAAVSTINPWGIDVASGVESSPGIKSNSAVNELIRSARTARS